MRAPWLLVACLLATPTPAQITTDGTLGPRVELTGPEMTIGAELGHTRGANLFHSFQRFDIPVDHRATFTGPDRIHNVVGRVTGGQVSTIDGQLRSRVGQADVYLINPAGVVMGPSATVDVPAALHVSTADALRFADGTTFSARDPGSASTLTMAAPEAFWFLGPSPGNLTLSGTRLEVRDGQSLSLSGGDVAIRGSAEHAARLSAPGGTLRLDAVGAATAAIPLSAPPPLTLEPPLAAADLAHRGQLELTRAQLETSGDGGGRIGLHAGAATLTEATLIAENQGPTDATGGIEARIAGMLRLDRSWLFADTMASGRGGIARVLAGELRMDASRLTSDTYRRNDVSVTGAIGPAGGVAVQTDGSLVMDNGSLIQSATLTEGQAGTVTVQVAEQLEVLRGTAIFSGTRAAGAAGDVTITAGSARLDGAGLDAQFTGLVSQAASGSSGAAGTLTLSVDGLLEVLRGAQISSGTWSAGDAGDVIVTAGSARLDNAGLDGQVTGLGSPAASGSGAAGSVTLTVAGLLEVLRGAVITSSTWSAGAAGDVTVTAGSARLDNAGLDGQFTGLASQANSGSGAAGTVTLTVTDLLEVLRGAVITSSTWSEGAAGDVTVTAGSARLDREGLDGQVTGLFSSAESGSGAGGRVTLSVDGLLEVLRGAVISSSTWSEGAAGDVTVTAGSARLDNAGLDGQITLIASNAYSSSSAAGTVTLTVDGLLEVLRGAVISSGTWSAGAAGDVTVTAGSARLDGAGLDGQFTGLGSQAVPGSSGAAGTVTLTVDGLLEVLRGAHISSSTHAEGAAGDVIITAGSARLDDAGLDGQFTGLGSQAESGSSGAAGSVTLTVDGLLEVLRGAEISSSTFASGHAGSVKVAAQDLRLEHGFIASQTMQEATGRVGDVEITAQRLTLRDGSVISIAQQNAAAPADPAAATPALRVRAGTLALDASRLNAASQGPVAAGLIAIQADTATLTNTSRISTQSQQADAGPITLAGGWLWLRDSQITTSAEGAAGNGGAITLSPTQLLLDSGFIQANAASGNGGQIAIRPEVLLYPATQALILGGRERLTFTPGSGLNVIQAVAPQGVSGNLDVTAPTLDLAAALAAVVVPWDDPEDLLDTRCRAVADPERASSLIDLSAGGAPATAPAGTSARLESLLDGLDAGP